MSEIITSIEPGYYPTAQTLTVTFPPNTRKAIYTTSDRPPVLSEVIAYDEGPIVEGGPSVPRPFIAVTQDGRGNVIYDGGFPKFYNMRIYQFANKWPTLPYTFDQLPPQFKYLNNALKFCANISKYAAGNRKILLLGDVKTGSYCTTISQRYPDASGAVSPQGSVGFKDSFEAIAEAGGWELTIKTSADGPGGRIDYDLDYLEQFVAVIYMSSSAYGAPPANANGYTGTPRFIQAMSLYRSAGSGIILITDHANANFTSVADALKRNFYFVVNANSIATNFGAYFSGNVDRKNVTVGEIRRQLALNGGPGDHPLLAGMTNDEIIAAGASESLTEVEVFTDDEVDPLQPLVVDLSTPGIHRVNILVQLEDGSILTKPMLFIIMFDGDILMTDTQGRTLTDQTVTYKAGVDYSLKLASSMSQVVTGELEVNGLLQGYFQVNNGVVTYTLLAGPGSAVRVNSGDKITMNITAPFEYPVSTTVTIPDGTEYYESSGMVGTFLDKIRTHPYFTAITDQKVILRDLSRFAYTHFADAVRLGPAIPTHYWRSIGTGRFGLKPSKYIAINLGIYIDPNDWTTNGPATGSIGDAVIIASTNDIYYWSNDTRAWVLHPAKASTLFGVDREGTNRRNGTKWIVKATNTIPLTV